MTTLSRLSRLSLLIAGVFLWLFSLSANAATNPLTAPGDLEQRLAACSQCHGKLGQGNAGDTRTPHLAGKPVGYLYQQLQSFKMGKRNHAPMQYVVKQLSDDYLKLISHYYASQPVVYEPQQVAISDEEFERGRLLSLEGEGQIPSCKSCHGPNLMGVKPMIPGVLGLSYEYLERQLKLWHQNARVSDNTNCMWIVANRMKLDDIKAVSAWLAAQPVPNDASLISEENLTEPLPGWCNVAHTEVAL